MITCNFKQVVENLKFDPCLNNGEVARIFLLSDLQIFFSDLGSGEQKKINKKYLKMTSKLVIFRALLFIYFSELFF